MILVIDDLSNGELLQRRQTRSHCDGKANRKYLHFLKQSGQLLTTKPKVNVGKPLYYRKRGSASYIVREVLLVREREIQTERERETEVTSPLSR